MLLWVAIVTDVADGYLARRMNIVSPIGGFADHASDATFVTLLLATHAWFGVITPVLPLLVPITFIQYALDSRILAGKPLRASILGRYNGVFYFVLAGFPIMQHALGLYPLSAVMLHGFAWILVTTTVISMGERFFVLLKSWKQP